MLNKTLSLLIILGLVATTNFSVLAQSQSSEVKHSQQSNVLPEKAFLLKLGVDSAERANQLLDADSFAKVKKDSLSSKAMQDADNAQQKKKFAGMGKTTAIVIGAGLAAAIIIVLATRGGKSQNIVPPNCSQFPCR